MLQSQLQTQPLASLISYENGQPVSVLAGAAVALANRSDLNVLSDIEHQRVVPLTALAPFPPAPPPKILVCIIRIHVCTTPTIAATGINFCLKRQTCIHNPTLTWC